MCVDGEFTIFFNYTHTGLNRMKIKHVSIHYVPSSGRVISQVLKPTTSGVYSCHRPRGVHCCNVEFLRLGSAEPTVWSSEINSGINT